MKKKFSKVKKRNAVISFVLILSLLITGIFAFLWSTDSKINPFTIGKVDVVVREDDWYDNDGNMLGDDNNNGVPDFAENLVPGDTIDKAPYVENVGKNDAHVFLVVGMPVEHSNTIYTGDGSFSGVGTSSPGEITVTAYAIQENYAGLTDSEDIWNAYVEKTGVQNILGSAYSGDEADKYIELFELVGLNTVNWTPVSILSDYDTEATNVVKTNKFLADDGHYYYIYKYNKNNSAILNTDSITETLFSGVKLIEDIGEEYIEPFTVNYYGAASSLSEVYTPEPTFTETLAKTFPLLTAFVLDSADDGYCCGYCEDEDCECDCYLEHCDAHNVNFCGEHESCVDCDNTCDCCGLIADDCNCSGRWCGDCGCCENHWGWCDICNTCEDCCSCEHCDCCGNRIDDCNCSGRRCDDCGNCENCYGWCEKCNKCENCCECETEIQTWHCNCCNADFEEDTDCLCSGSVCPDCNRCEHHVGALCTTCGKCSNCCKGHSSQEPDTPTKKKGFIADKDQKLVVDYSDCVLLRTEVYQGVANIETLLMDDNLYEEGCTFNWRFADVEDEKVYISTDAAYSGMEVSETINLVGVNADISDGVEATDYLAYRICSDYAEVHGANYNDINYPTEPTTVNVPMFLRMRLEGEKTQDSILIYTYTILNGYNLYYHGGGIHFFSKTISLDVAISDKCKTSEENIYEIPVTSVYVSGYTKNGETETSTPGNALVSIAKKLIVPESVTNIEYIGNYMGKTNYSVLEEINIPFECQYLGADSLFMAGLEGNSYGLYNNTHLTTIINGFPNTLKILGHECFVNTAIQELTLPNSVEIIGPHVFNNTKATVPSTIKYIMDDAFEGATTVKFESVNWKLKECSFSDCGSLGVNLGCQNVEFNCTLEEFKHSDAYKTLHFGNGLRNYNSIKFTDITLISGDKVQCKNCGRMTWSQFPCQCEYSEAALYEDNEILLTNNLTTEINIKDGVTSIPYRAFSNFRYVTSITIPDSVTSIELYAFQNCDNLSNIIVSENNTVYDSRDNCNAIIETATNTLIRGCKNTVIPDSVTTIGEYAFFGCYGLTDITIPDSVTSIGEAAFNSCKIITINIPDSVTSVSDRAFGIFFFPTCSITISQSTYDTIITNNPNAFTDFYGTFNFT